MAAASSQGGADTGDGGGEAGDEGGELTHGGACLGGGAEDGDCCGSSNPGTGKEVSPLKAPTGAMARFWKEQPPQSNVWTTGAASSKNPHPLLSLSLYLISDLH